MPPTLTHLPLLLILTHHISPTTAVPLGMTYTSYVLGYISFIITVLTVLGVYRDLLSTLRNAGIQIPIMLGNLRQEILTEKFFLRYRIKHGDEYGVFPRELARGYVPAGPKRGRRAGRGGRTERKAERGDARKMYSELLEATIKDLWIEFKNLERPFLIPSGLRAKAVEKGDYWDEKDIEAGGGGVGGGGKQIEFDVDADNKMFPPSGRQSRRRMEHYKEAEDAIARQGARYYQTGLGHRWIWWQSKGSVQRLLDQVQRIQIRRIERDLFETDELVKRLVRMGGGGGGVGEGSGSGSGSSSGSDGRGPRSRKSGVVVRSRPGSVVSRPGSIRSVRMPSRGGSVSGRTVRAVDEREVIRRPARSPPRPVRRSDVEESNTARRRERRSEPRVEYEVLRPRGGVVYVDDDRGPSRRTRVYSDDDDRNVQRRRSYSREG